MQIPFVLLQVIPITRLTRGDGSGRTAFRGGRQNVAETGFRLSSCIPLGARGSRISVLLPPRARLRGSRRGCLDVLTGCHLGTYCCPLSFGRLRDKRWPAPPKHAREFPRAVFLPFPELLKHTALPTGFLLSRNPSISDEKTIFRHGRNLPNINGWVAKKRWRADFLVRGMSKSHFFYNFAADLQEPEAAADLNSAHWRKAGTERREYICWISGKLRLKTAS